MVDVEAAKTTPGACACDSDKAVFSVRIISTSTESFDRLYGYLTTFMELKECTIHGFVRAQLLASDDKTRIIVMVEWKRLEDWVRSEWEIELGALLEELLCDGQAIDFRLYSGDHFIAAKHVTA